MGDRDAAFFDKLGESVVEICDVRLESLWTEEAKLKGKKRGQLSPGPVGVGDTFLKQTNLVKDFFIIQTFCLQSHINLIPTFTHVTLHPYISVLSDIGKTLQEFVRADGDETGSNDRLN